MYNALCAFVESMRVNPNMQAETSMTHKFLILRLMRLETIIVEAIKRPMRAIEGAIES